MHAARTGPSSVRGVAVRESDDAGGYYCEHLLFAALCAAEAPGGSVRQGDEGPLVGFLHVPDDAATYGTTRQGEGPAGTGAGRHDETAHLVEATIVGWAAQVPGDAPVRVLITGFGPFRDVVDNPTGDFVSDRDAMANVERRASREGHAVELVPRLLPVDDETLSPGSVRSIRALIEELRPDAVLCLGVVADRELESRVYRVETRASDRRLRRDGATWQHDEAAIRTEVRATRALACVLLERRDREERWRSP